MSRSSPWGKARKDMQQDMRAEAEEAPRPEGYTSPPNPADRPLVTLDTNVLIALRNDEPAAPSVQSLLALNRTEVITINITLSTALERRRVGELRDMQAYDAWLRSLGITTGHIFTAPRTIGFNTPGEPGTITFGVELELAANRRVHEILCPTIPFSWFEYRDRECERRGMSRAAMAELDQERWVGSYIRPSPDAPARRPTPALDALSPEEREELRILHARLNRIWSNEKNDALGLYNHITQAWHTTHPEHAVFVTSDGGFLRAQRREALQRLGYHGQLLPPGRAVEYLLAITGAVLS